MRLSQVLNLCHHANVLVPTAKLPHQIYLLEKSSITDAEFKYDETM